MAAKDEKTVGAKILERTRLVGKTYSFDDKHDPSLPADHWMQDTPEGSTLFLIFYTQACQWSQCLGCSLPTLMSREHVPFGKIMRQVDHVFDTMLPAAKARALKKIILSNNGSVLDEKTFSTTALIYFVAKMNLHCPNVEVLTIESRAEYIDEAELEALARALGEGDTPTTLELAVGFEAFDDAIRNRVFKKGLSLASVERTAKFAARHGFRLKTYFMLKPVPGMSEDEAVADIEKGMIYLDALSRKTGVAVNMHLNATYVAKGTALEEEFHAGRYSPPLLESLRRAAFAGKGRRLSLYLGLYDENLAVPGGSFVRPGDGPLLKRMQEFNRTQDYGLLKPAGGSAR